MTDDSFPDWLVVCRRAAERVQQVLDGFGPGEAATERGRGAGGDMTLALDWDAEGAILAELEALGIAMTVVSEERGEVALNGGGDLHLAVDPIDGSRNARRGTPFFAVSIAVATGPTVADVEFGFVRDLGGGEEWWARRGAGAFRDGHELERLRAQQLELVGLEIARAALVADSAAQIAATGAQRVRAFGAIALSLCYLAGGRLDAVISLGASRSVDIAAGQLIVREAGGAVAFPDANGPAWPLALQPRSRVLAAASDALLEQLLAAVHR